MIQTPMLSLTTLPSRPLQAATDTAVRQERQPTALPEEALLAALIAHIRDKRLNDAECIQAIRATLKQSAAG